MFPVPWVHCSVYVFICVPYTISRMGSSSPVSVISPLIVACRHGQIGIVRHILQHDYYVIDPQILAQAASVARESGYEQIRSLLTLYYIKYYRYSA